MLRMVLLVFILASAAFLSAITAMRIAIHGREVSMPNLVGKNVSEASSDCVRADWCCGSPIECTASADQHGGAADTVAGIADESFAAGARGVEPGAAATADSAAGRKFPERFRESNCCARVCRLARSRI